MYTVATEVLLKMTRVEPHEKLQAAGRFLGVQGFMFGL